MKKNKLALFLAFICSISLIGDDSQQKKLLVQRQLFSNAMYSAGLLGGSLMLAPTIIPFVPATLIPAGSLYIASLYGLTAVNSGAVLAYSIPDVLNALKKKASLKQQEQVLPHQILPEPLIQPIAMNPPLKQPVKDEVSKKKP